MASEQEVKQYLAYWLQLGKKVAIGNSQATLLPQEVIKGATLNLGKLKDLRSL